MGWDRINVIYIFNDKKDLLKSIVYKTTDNIFKFRLIKYFYKTVF